MTRFQSTIRHGGRVGGPTQTFALATELIRAGAGGVHLENQDPANRTCHIVNVGKQKRDKLAKQAGTLITNPQLADLGYTLQFPILFNFNTAGLALEKDLQKFKAKGLEGLADLQIEEDAGAGGYPDTKMHQKFAGMNRRLILESVFRSGPDLVERRATR